jgi:hypothetical protein
VSHVLNRMVSIIPCWVNLSGTSFRIDLCQGVTKRCRLFWLINCALGYEPKCGGKGGASCRFTANEYTAVHRSPNKLRRFNSLFNLCPCRVNVIPCRQHEFEPHFGYSVNPESKSENLQENPEGEVIVKTTPGICSLSSSCKLRCVALGQVTCSLYCKPSETLRLRIRCTWVSW